MAKSYDVLENIHAKIEWEGGLFEAAYGYGIRHGDIDPDVLPELHQAWKAMDEAYEKHFGPAYGRVLELLLGGE